MPPLALAPRAALFSADEATALTAALGGDPDSVVDAVGRSSIILAASPAVTRGGEVVLLGTPRVPEPAEDVTRFFRRVHSAGLHVIGAHGNSLPVRAPAHAPSARRNLDDLYGWAHAGRLHLAPLAWGPMGWPGLTRAWNGNGMRTWRWYWTGAAPGSAPQAASPGA